MNKTASIGLAFALLVCNYGVARGRGGQDFPFFICRSTGGAPAEFRLGPTAESPTGYGLWVEDDEGDWTMSAATVSEAGSSFLVTGTVQDTGEAFRAKIPLSCAAQCISRFDFDTTDACVQAPTVCRLIHR